MIVAGNWKMYKLIDEAGKLATQLKKQLSKIKPAVTPVVCPPFTALAEVASIIKGSRLLLGGQDMHWETQGAYTGEVSAAMLKDAGCACVIIGHSERRQYFGETDATVNKKVHAALKVGLKPIMCVGETEAQREQGQTEAVIVRQVEGGLNDVAVDQFAQVIVAYEPVWAIGTGKNATPGQAQEVHALIRRLVRDRFKAATASDLPILYGGSVKPENALELFLQPDINGGLIGGASLTADSFVQIVRAGEAAVS
ncbi:MAG: triose-phosphate isomerase [Candidatus Abyssobacteria bacterium SURF_5]|jgi:triosephosphate isomerase|uniref:Triosephosphate isomerase n=1 Tax=Abyssobacteria bacterium (strain SURF_5) TaxID=2093360 RepID=A0A3A4NQQ6_ABYX5|nr:MAG: triose-phosphate isomerase [Candidatus Abyssubacteria bacterium SURF_5]